MGAVTLAGITLGAAASPVQAMSRSANSVIVPCDAATLVTEIQAANTAGVATLLLAPNCIYNYATGTTPSDALPIITGDVTLVGGLNTTIRRDPAAPGFRILEVASGATLRVRNVSILGGSTSGLGGGIQNAGTVVLEHTILAGNRAMNGGAFANLAGATAMISHSVLKENTAASVGGGAAINFAGTLTLSDVILTRNSAPINGGALNTQPGGVSNLVKSIVRNNTSGSPGGGISNLGTLNLDGTVVGQNRGSGGGGIATANANVTLRNSIVNDNSPDNCSPPNTIPGCVN
ncbi:hypothetical protein [Planotetraspora kaengkrachanensis]|uniref:hypothetical protein n=1 Tax=Planotetraspora kaengkrachanensis TaxID=575193 RepID=UPI0019429D9F|nr:hypothetical protein [Planotetraspora kaengkrachanensis]